MTQPGKRAGFFLQFEKNQTNMFFITRLWEHKFHISVVFRLDLETGSCFGCYRPILCPESSRSLF